MWPMSLQSTRCSRARRTSQNKANRSSIRRRLGKVTIRAAAGRRNPSTEPRARKEIPSPMEGSKVTKMAPTTASRVWLCTSARARLTNGDEFIDVGLRLSGRIVAAGARSRGAADVVGHSSSFLHLVLSGHNCEIIDLLLFGGVSNVLCSTLFPIPFCLQMKMERQTRVSGTPLMR